MVMVSEWLLMEAVIVRYFYPLNPPFTDPHTTLQYNVPQISAFITMQYQNANQLQCNTPHSVPSKALPHTNCKHASKYVMEYNGYMHACIQTMHPMILSTRKEINENVQLYNHETPGFNIQFNLKVNQG